MPPKQDHKRRKVDSCSMEGVETKPQKDSEEESVWCSKRLEGNKAFGNALVPGLSPVLYSSRLFKALRYVRSL